MKGIHSNFVDCPPIENHKQSLNNNVIAQESEDARSPWFSYERIVVEESGGAILDTNNDATLMSPVVGTPTLTYHCRNPAVLLYLLKKYITRHG